MRSRRPSKFQSTIVKCAPLLKLMDFATAGIQPPEDVRVSSAVGVYQVTTINADRADIPTDMREFMQGKYHNLGIGVEPGDDTWEETDRYWIRYHRTARRMRQDVGRGGST